MIQITTVASKGIKNDITKDGAMTVLDGQGSDSNSKPISFLVCESVFSVIHSILFASRFGIAEGLFAFALIGVLNVSFVVAAFLAFSRWAISPIPLIIGIFVVTIVGLKFVGGISLFAFPGFGALIMMTAYFVFRKKGWA